MTIFVLTKEDKIFKLDLEQETHDIIEKEFLEAEKRFLKDAISLEYDPLYKLEKDEYFVIDNFPDTHKILEAITIPRKIGKWMLDSDIQAIFVGISDEFGKRALIQYFDQRQIIDNSRTLWQLVKDKSFLRIPDSFGITISKEIVAILDENRLKFKTPLYTDRILDLSSYQLEASKKDIIDLERSSNIYIENIDEFDHTLSKSERIKLSQIKASGVLEKTAIDICRIASELGVTLKTTDDKDRIVMPNDKKQRKELIEVLNEDRFSGPFTSQIMRANSKIRVKTPT